MLSALATAGQGLTTTVTRLISGTTNYWSVQAIDTSYQGSPFAADSGFIHSVPMPVIRFDAWSQDIAEGVGTMSVTDALTTSSGLTVTVPFTGGGTASVGSDHDLVDRVLTFLPSQTPRTLTFAVLADAIAGWQRPQSLP